MARSSCVLSNDLRISCKRLARLALPYVPLAATGSAPSTELCPDELVGCMRGLGGTRLVADLQPVTNFSSYQRGTRRAPTASPPVYDGFLTTSVITGDLAIRNSRAHAGAHTSALRLVDTGGEIDESSGPHSMTR